MFSFPQLSSYIVIFLFLFLQYFHPDNMSSAEKLALELKKVRDEFKMSESDCGSARVQGKVIVTLIHAVFVQI